MERMFPSALVSCIGEGRPPERDELLAVAAKIWDEGLLDQRWSERVPALMAARAAMVGESPDGPCDPTLLLETGVVELRGIEPLTSAVRLQRSPI